MPNRPSGARVPCRPIHAVGLAAFCLFLSPLAVSEAKADLRVCNGTQALVGVAIGYRGEEGWVSEGWWRIPAATCRSVIEGQLASRYYYLYAEDSEGVGRWAGETNLCIAENEFRVVGVENCFARGYQEMGFREYDTGAQASWMVQLNEAPRETGSAAGAAQSNISDEPSPEPEDSGEVAPDAPADGEPAAQ